jgi:hypothetical protein
MQNLFDRTDLCHKSICGERADEPADTLGLCTSERREQDRSFVATNALELDGRLSFLPQGAPS